MLQKQLESHSISHFCIGGDSKSGTDNIHVTVSNVLLHNRVLKKNELNPLMKTNAVAAPETEVSAPAGAPQNSHLSQSSDQTANESVVINKAPHDATMSPQKQQSPPEPSKNKNGPSVSRQTSSTDSTGSSTSAAEWEVEEVVPSSVDSASSLPLTAGEGGPQKEVGTDVPSGVDYFESEQGHSSPSVAQPITEQADEAVDATPQREATEDRPQHSTLSDASENVEESSPHSAPLATDEQPVDPEGGKDTNPHTAVGASRGP
ncbi:trans-sialidase, putative, partial [Trypanosoma cruzi marinkellei]